MSVPSSAREALIAETLGEMAAILERVEAVKPMLAEACAAVAQASASLAAQAAAMEARVTTVADVAAAHSVKHITRRADELLRASAEVETRSMEIAARKLFRDELAPVLQRLSRALASSEGPRNVLIRTAFSYGAAAIIASALTWSLALHVIAGCGS